MKTGLALAPWGVLAFGKIRTDEEEERRRQTGEKGEFVAMLSCAAHRTVRIGRTIVIPDWERTEDEKKMCKALEEIAKQVGAKSIQAGKCFGTRWPRASLAHISIM